MIEAKSFIEHLTKLGYSQYAGVPCSFLKPFINYVIDDPELDYVGATSEGEAVALNLGAHLAGRKTVTMCQNSGLGNMVNPLTSLNTPFRVPTLLIVTWRGQPGLTDEPQHEQMGRVMHDLLDAMEIPWKPFPKDEADIAPVMEEAERYMREHERPFALIMEKGSVAPHALQSKPTPERVDARVVDRLTDAKGPRLTRTEALQTIMSVLGGEEAVVATTGKTGRELHDLEDRENQIYVVGGMGTASAIGFGIAYARPERKVVVLDGDGAALMKLGNLATIGHYQPSNLLHVILDNESHDSTGGQSTVSPVARFADAAAAMNYRHAHAVGDKEGLEASLKRFAEEPGPSLVHVKIKPGSPEKLGRPKVTPLEVRDRFMRFLSDGSGTT